MRVQHVLEKMQKRKGEGKKSYIIVGDDGYVFYHVTWGGASPVLTVNDPTAEPGTYGSQVTHSVADWRRMGAKYAWTLTGAQHDF